MSGERKWSRLSSCRSQKTVGCECLLLLSRHRIILYNEDIFSFVSPERNRWYWHRYASPFFSLLFFPPIFIRTVSSIRFFYTSSTVKSYVYYRMTYDNFHIHWSETYLPFTIQSQKYIIYKWNSIIFIFCAYKTYAMVQSFYAYASQ